MRSKPFVVLTLAMGFIVGSDPMLAHHAGTIYDTEHKITLTGTVTSFELVNPHARIFFVVKDENGVETPWVGGAGAVMRMVRIHGWRRDSLKPGDTITVTGSPLRSGKKGELRIKTVVMPDGKIFNTGAEQ